MGMYSYTKRLETTQYGQTWISRLSEGTPQLFAAGDLDGDGNAEFAICAKTGTHVGTTELDIRYYHWLLTIFKSNGDDVYRAVWTQRIRDVWDGGNGMTIADVNNDGRNELCLAVQPNCYLVQYDGIGYRPIWHHTATSTFNPIVVDLNGDGAKALLFNSRNALTVFQTPASTTPQLRGLPNPPWGITAKPIDERSVHLTWRGSEDAILTPSIAENVRIHWKRSVMGFGKRVSQILDLPRTKRTGMQSRLRIQMVHFQGIPHRYLSCQHDDRAYGPLCLRRRINSYWSSINRWVSLRHTRGVTGYTSREARNTVRKATRRVRRSLTTHKSGLCLPSLQKSFAQGIGIRLRHFNFRIYTVQISQKMPVC